MTTELMDMVKEATVTYYHVTIFINGTEKIHLPSLVKNVQYDTNERWIEITTRSGAVLDYAGLPFVVYRMEIPNTFDIIHIDAIFNQNRILH